MRLMRQRGVAALALAFSACGGTPSGPSSDTTKPEAILGTWELVSAEKGGKPEEVQWTKLVVEDDKVRYHSPLGIEELPLILDSKKTPGEYELQIVNRHGIYKVEGDKLYLSESTSAEGKRPTEFSSKPGTEHRYLVLKRVKE